MALLVFPAQGKTKGQRVGSATRQQENKSQGLKLRTKRALFEALLTKDSIKKKTQKS
jgi:hypothetical protein